MLDLHTHLLPCVDDGCKSADEALELMARLESIGFDSIVLTPHFYPSRETSKNFILRRDSAMSALKEHCDGKNITVACECYLNEYLFNCEDITPLCIIDGGKKYLLIELSYSNMDRKRMLRLCEKVIVTYGVTPVLAHIERYPYIIKNEEFFKKFIEAGCLCQVNMKSFCSLFRRKRLAYYVEKGYITFIGSDTHRSPFDARAHIRASAYLEKRFGQEWRNKFQNGN